MKSGLGAEGFFKCCIILTVIDSMVILEISISVYFLSIYAPRIGKRPDYIFFKKYYEKKRMTRDRAIIFQR